MKNKHLVIIFILVAALGWLLRDLPWRRDEPFKAQLVRVAPKDVLFISVQVPDMPALTLERADSGWLAQQEMRDEWVSDDRIQPFLSNLCSLHSQQALPVQKADSLLLDAGRALFITLKTRQGRTERIWLGIRLPCRDTICTAVRVGSIEACFLVAGNVYEGVPHTLAEFGQAYFPDCIPAQITGIRLEGIGADTLIRWRAENGRSWFDEKDMTDSLSNDSVQIWLQQWLILRATARPANHLDEWRLTRHTVGRIIFNTASGRQSVSLYYLPKPELPEVPGNYSDRSVLTSNWFVRAEPSDGRYFALPDSGMVRRWLNTTTQLMSSD